MPGEPQQWMSAYLRLPLEDMQINSSAVTQFHAFTFQQTSLEPFHSSIVSVTDASLGIHNPVPRHLRTCRQRLQDGADLSRMTPPPRQRRNLSIRRHATAGDPADQ